MDIVIRDFPMIISTPEIKRLFRNYGSVKDVQKEKMRSVAIVKMPHSYQANHAIEDLNGSEFYGKKIKVEKSPDCLKQI